MSRKYQETEILAQFDFWGDVPHFSETCDALIFGATTQL